MTGEITLRGRVLPVGGIKEKTLAAHRAGIRTVLLPKENEKDLEELPENIRQDMCFQHVSHMDEVLNFVLLPAVETAPPVETAAEEAVTEVKSKRKAGKTRE